MSNNRLSPEQLPDQITQHLTEEQRDDIKSFREGLKRLILPLATNDLSRARNKEIELYQDLQADGIELSEEERSIAQLSKSETLETYVIQQAVQSVVDLCQDFKTKLDLPISIDIRNNPLRLAFFSVLDSCVYFGLSNDTYGTLAKATQIVWPEKKRAQ